MMFQKQNTHNNRFSCEPCEWTCEPFYKIIHTVKAFICNTFSNLVNHVNDFLAHARERNKHLCPSFLIKLFKFDQKSNSIKNSPRATKSYKSFTSFTCIINICFISNFHVNDVLKPFTRSFTSFTWK